MGGEAGLRFSRKCLVQKVLIVIEFPHVELPQFEVSIFRREAALAALGLTVDAFAMLIDQTVKLLVLHLLYVSAGAGHHPQVIDLVSDRAHHHPSLHLERTGLSCEEVDLFHDLSGKLAEVSLCKCSLAVLRHEILRLFQLQNLPQRVIPV